MSSKHVHIDGGLYDDAVITVRTAGDAFARVAVEPDGEIRLGDGTAEPAPFGRAENVAEFAETAELTAPEVADALNSVISALVDAGLMVAPEPEPEGEPE